MRMAVPSSFMDVSLVRQVPDNQEVFVDQASDQSLIVEIVEPHESAKSDARGAAVWHWNVLADDSSASSRTLLWGGRCSDASERAGKICNTGGNALSLAAGLQSVSKFRDAVELASEVRVHLACIHLPRADTHILLTLSAAQRHHAAARIDAPPAAAPEDAERGPAMPFYRALASLEVLEWSLFGVS